MNQSEK